MKYIHSFWVAAMIALFANWNVDAQQRTAKCADPAVQGQAENIKSVFSKQGLVVFQESMLSMQSMEPTPIAVRLQAGISYQLIFVGSSSANRLTMELFDGSDKKIDEKVEKGGNYIIYTFKPKKTEIYLITLYQKKAMRDMCGYFAIMTQKLKNTPLKAAPLKRTPPATTQKTTPQKQTTTIKSTPTTKTITPTSKNNTLPDNQRPNPNRTRATKEYQQQQQR